MLRYMNEACHAYACVMTRVWRSHVPASA